MKSAQTLLWNPITLGLLAIGLGFAVFGSSLPAPYFTMDDYEVILSNAKIVAPTLVSMLKLFVPPHPPVFIFPEYYPVRDLSFAASFYVGADQPCHHRFLNIILHIANALLLFGLFRRLGIARGGAAIASALFLWHPLSVEPVVWISGRKELLATLFSLIVMLSLEGLANHQHPWKQMRYWTAVMAYTAGLLSKGSMIALLPLIFLFVWWQRKVKLKLSHAGCFALPLVTLTLLNLAHLLWLRFSHASGANLSEYGYHFRPMLYLLSMLKNFTLFLWPDRLSTYIADDWVLQATLISKLSAAILFALLVVALIWSFKKEKTIFFGLGLFCLSWLPYANIIANPILLAERYLYFPIMGLFLAVAASWRQLTSASLRKLLNLTLILLWGGWGWWTHARAQLWLEPVQYWQDVEEHFPNSVGASFALGHAYIRQSDWQNGCMTYQQLLPQLLTYHPSLQAIVLETLANCALKRKQGCRSAEFYWRACAIEPDPNRCQKTLKIWRELGYPKQAQSLYDHLMRQNPKFTGLLHRPTDNVDEKGVPECTTYRSQLSNILLSPRKN